MNEEQIKRLERAVANLRHAYSHMVNGTMGKPEDLARGLISTAIFEIERALSNKNQVPE